MNGTSAFRLGLLLRDPEKNSYILIPLLFFVGVMISVVYAKGIPGKAKGIVWVFCILLYILYVIGMTQILLP
ncbi:MAG: hypothetical protein Q7S76_03970 [bacterium]|nr:hypothetical protein [bacterium]